MIRPSFVLGGRGMEVIYDETMLQNTLLKRWVLHQTALFSRPFLM